MIDFTMAFPPDFRWGTASAAHQVEGNNTNNQWWAWEQISGNILNGDRSGLACDWWANAEADFDRMVELGLNAHRLSVEWSRIEPREGVFDSAAIDRYRSMLLGLRQRGIEPMVTLHHFTNPIWLEEKGGWEHADKVVPLFERFATKAAESFGDLCDLWCTVNEPNVYAVMAYLSGGRMPPGRPGRLDLTFSVLRSLLFGHAAAYRAIHRVQPRAHVGLAHHFRPFEPLRPRNVLDSVVAKLQDLGFNQGVLHPLFDGRWSLPAPRGAGNAKALKGTLDWIGVNYYSRGRTAFNPRSRDSMFGTVEYTPGALMTDHGYGEVYPHGLSTVINWAARAKLPIYITENGLPDERDALRPSFLVTHLRETWKAIQQCNYVKGYYHWTLVDNFEWSDGFRMKFGLYSVNRATQERTPRPSAAVYADIAKHNAITSDMVRRHAPELMATDFPS